MVKPMQLFLQWMEPSNIFIDLINNDSRETLQVLKPNSVHLAVTDPPYFLDGLDDGWKKADVKVTKNQLVKSMHAGMKFDKQQGKALQAFMEQVGAALFRVLMPGSFALVFSQPRLTHRMAIGLEDAGFEIRDLFAWHFTKRAQFKAFTMDHFIDKMDIKDKDELKADMYNRRTPQLRPLFESIILA